MVKKVSRVTVPLEGRITARNERTSERVAKAASQQRPDRKNRKQVILASSTEMGQPETFYGVGLGGVGGVGFLLFRGQDSAASVGADREDADASFVEV